MKSMLGVVCIMRDPESTHLAEATDQQLFGGAPLSEDVGNTLASAGVSLFSIYGW